MLRNWRRELLQEFVSQSHLRNGNWEVACAWRSGTFSFTSFFKVLRNTHSNCNPMGRIIPFFPNDFCPSAKPFLDTNVWSNYPHPMWFTSSNKKRIKYIKARFVFKLGAEECIIKLQRKNSNFKKHAHTTTINMPRNLPRSSGERSAQDRRMPMSGGLAAASRRGS